ncbi:MAG TPA: ThuA domain-containing protein [Sphingomonadaceae bacterium]|nr:ThuA domain-containing protein [Sphingomonadaceae bacterium]
MLAPLIANLICGSPHRNHDFDFARLRLAQALYDAGNIRADCFQTYEDSTAILGGNLLVSYTSQVPVSEAASSAIRHYLEEGGRWFALHASNSVLDNRVMPHVLGTRFVTHPPYQRFPVQITKPNDPLLQGIAPFDIDDELYCIETMTDDIEVLLHTRWGGEAFGGRVLEVEDRPLMYRRRVGEGGVLYLALGHANRPYDKPFSHMPDQPDHRGPWDLPVYKELIQRGIAWAAGRRPL